VSAGVFDAYAAYYDLLNRGKDYEAEAAYIDTLLQRHLPGARHILELGCGTGAHAERFASRGYSVTGIDRSQEMVKRANARRASLPEDIARRMEFTVGDIASVRVARTFDAVVSLFHVFSYLTTNSALHEAMQTSATHLRAGGLLCFDYWHGPGVLTQRPEARTRRLEDEACSVERRATPDTKVAENLVRVRFDIEVQDKGDGSKTQFTESHDMRYLFLPEIEWMAGPCFKPLQHCAWLGFNEPGVGDWSAVSVLERLP
jgi:SAM-dependent methyltransferase